MEATENRRGKSTRETLILAGLEELNEYGVQHFSTQVELDVDIFCGENELVVFHDIPSLLQMVLRVGGVREGVADQIERNGNKAQDEGGVQQLVAQPGLHHHLAAIID